MKILVLIGIVVTLSCYDAAPTNTTVSQTIRIQLGPEVQGYYVKEDHDTYFVCDVQPSTYRDYYKITWYHNDTLITPSLKSGITIVNNYLILQHVNKTSIGSYFCQTETDQGALKSDSVFLEIKDASFMTKVKPGDEYLADSYLYLRTPVPAYDIYLLGSDVMYECVITPDPGRPYTIFWYHDGLRVLNDPTNGVLLNKEILIVKNITTDSCGNYTCEAVVNGVQQHLVSNAVLMSYKYESWPNSYYGKNTYYVGRPISN